MIGVIVPAHNEEALLAPCLAALLEASHIETGWTAVDEFAARFVYFYSGYLFSRYVFALAEHVRLGVVRRRALSRDLTDRAFCHDAGGLREAF